MWTGLRNIDLNVFFGCFNTLDGACFSKLLRDRGTRTSQRGDAFQLMKIPWSAVWHNNSRMRRWVLLQDYKWVRSTMFLVQDSRTWFMCDRVNQSGRECDLVILPAGGSTSHSATGRGCSGPLFLLNGRAQGRMSSRGYWFRPHNDSLLNLCRSW